MQDWERHETFRFDALARDIGLIGRRGLNGADEAGVLVGGNMRLIAMRGRPALVPCPSRVPIVFAGRADHRRMSLDLKWVNAAFLIHDNQTRLIEDAKRLSRELSTSLVSADIIGLRAFGPNAWPVQIKRFPKQSTGKICPPR